MNDPAIKLTEIYSGGDYESEFEYDVETSHKRKKYDDLGLKSSRHISKPKRTKFVEECSKEHGHIRRFQFLATDAYSRHKEIINHYLLCYPGSTTKLRRNRNNDKTDIDIIRENHRFLWEDEEVDTWGKQLAKKYYDKLFKEYCLADLSRYKENKVALRWRTECEVIKGTGQFSCGNINCNNTENLTSWEVNFQYIEYKDKKNALVKLRLCPNCSYKLNYHHKRKEVKRRKFSSDLPDSLDKQVKKSKEDGDGSALAGQSLVRHVSETDSTSYLNKDKNIVENSDIWKEPHQEEMELKRTREDEFEFYLAEMLL